MEANQAVDVLIQVAHLAQSKGALNLNDAVAVAKAIEVLQAISNQSKAIQEEPELPQQKEVVKKLPVK